MKAFSDWVIPCVICMIVVYGFVKGCNILDAFVEGAVEGLKVVYKITPTMIAITLCVGMLKASGGMDLFASFVQPVVEGLKIPKEVVPLMLMRPISGTGALAIFKDIISTYNPDSYIGRVASVMQGATETTFYTMALYYGVTKVKNTRHTLVSALSADFTGFIIAAMSVSLLLS